MAFYSTDKLGMPGCCYCTGTGAVKFDKDEHAIPGLRGIDRECCCVKERERAGIKQRAFVTRAGKRSVALVWPSDDAHTTRYGE